MNIPTWLPAAVTFLGALIAGVGGLLQSVVQSRKSTADAKTQELVQDIAARSGNEEVLRELVETRSRLLSAERNTTETLISDIIAQAPTKAKDYRSMEDAKSDLVRQRTRAYLLAWEPLFRFTINIFDRAMSQVSEKGFEVRVEKNDVPFTQRGGNSSYSPRVAYYSGLRIDLQLNNAGIDVETMDDAYFFVRLVAESSNKIELEPLKLRIGENLATCGEHEFTAPADGLPPKELTDMIQQGIASAVERMLIVAQAERSE